ncbi:MAG: hypothetical protein WBW84_13440 [Acidobacteriaceae bacterium]
MLPEGIPGMILGFHAQQAVEKPERAIATVRILREFVCRRIAEIDLQA